MDLDPEAVMKTLGRHHRRMGEQAMATHTATPWKKRKWLGPKLGQYTPAFSIESDDETKPMGSRGRYRIAIVQGETNADFVVLACNRYEAVLAALRKAWDQADWSRVDGEVMNEISDAIGEDEADA